MASVYPGALDTFATNKANGTVTATDHPGHHNDLADAVNKIEAELGINPSGASATLVARLGLLASSTVIRKAADETVTSSAALQNDNELLFAIAASEAWVIFAYLFTDGATAGDIQATFTGPAGSTGVVAVVGPGTAATAFADSLVNNQGGAFAAGLPAGTFGAGNKTLVTVVGSVVNGATPGNVTLQWAQRASSATATTVYTGSFLVATRTA